jgi:hypothetical protein
VWQKTAPELPQQPRLWETRASFPKVNYAAPVKECVAGHARKARKVRIGKMLLGAFHLQETSNFGGGNW